MLFALSVQERKDLWLEQLHRPSSVHPTNTDFARITELNTVRTVELWMHGQAVHYSRGLLVKIFTKLQLSKITQMPQYNPRETASTFSM
jgi:hypothetical protein